MHVDSQIMEDINMETNLEELKLHKEKYEEVGESNLNNIRRLTDILMKKLEQGSIVPQVTERTKRLQEMFSKLSLLIREKQTLSEEIEQKHETLKSLYFEQKNALILADKEADRSVTEPRDMEVHAVLSEQELLEIQMERDKALGLVKVLLATLKSSRMQSEENFHKLKYSSDLMFHILYKAEDTFLNGPDGTSE